ncbi:MAG: sigma-70 family RNA polymerase sigma factor [Bacteroidales bacterium]|nr:sigma-70 family RNA polymerase sigma factor [Bacteroidales bacterium]
MPEIGDKELIERFKTKKDQNSVFSLLLQKYQTKIYWHIRKIVLNHDDTDDLTQNTFIKVYKNLHNFRQDSELYTWIYRIATNEALSFLKQKKRKLLFSLSDVEDYLLNNLKSDKYFNGDELQQKLQNILLKLPEKQRLVFNMKYFDDMKYEDMAKILKTSVGALKASYHHAVKKIEKFLDND